MADQITPEDENEISSTPLKRKRMSRLTCAQCEAMLLDAADGLLLSEEQTQFEFHMADCPNCTRLYADVRRGGAWMEVLKDDPPVPPDGMVTRILAKTSGDPVLASEVAAQTAYAASLLGHAPGKVLPFRAPVPRTPLARIMHTVMQPRLMMTAAMAFFSIALTLNIAGVRITALRASDLRPATLRKSMWAMNNRVVRYYDNLRVVYELESRVREMQRESDEDTAPKRGILSSPAQDQPLREAPKGTPHSSVPAPRHTPEALASRMAARQVATHTFASSNGSKGVQA